MNFLYEKREKENLYVEFETERIQKDKYFHTVFMGYETVPKKYVSVTKSLLSHKMIQLSPKCEGLPRYEVSIVFVYSDIGMYIFYGTRQLICKGWNEYVVGDKKKYTYFRLNYSDFEEERWKGYLENCLNSSAEFIENSLEEFVARK